MQILQNRLDIYISGPIAWHRDTLAQVTIRYLQDLLDLLKKLKKENEIKKE